MSRLFREIVRIRSAMYDRGHLTPRRLPHPVISVGNLTTGGTGKTPLVIALASKFRNLGYRPVILSRGYRRTSRGVVVVSRGGGPEVDWRAAGDEPFLMALRLPDVSVVVGVDRFAAGRKAGQERLGDLFILDDGFQHRRLSRDVDIVAISPGDWNGTERLLPWGCWREPRSALARAHAACVPAGAALVLPLPAFEFTTEVEGIFRNGALVDAGDIGQEPVVAFSGIARPERFFRTLESLGLNVTSRTCFPDHHVFRASELRNLPEGLRITTEKDAVRLGPGDCCYLRVSANILNFESLQDLILERIGSRTRSRPQKS
jgi:tetraacyldisaccharide 4'-kinase